MSSVNKVILVGRLGRDPESRTAGSSTVCNFTVATDESWTDKTGQRQEKTEWHRLVAWGKTGELVQKYLMKGSHVYVEGKLETREWEKDGVKRSTTEIKVDDVRFLDGRSSGPSKPSPRPAGGQKTKSDDDIPF